MSNAKTYPFDTPKQVAKLNQYLAKGDFPDYLGEPKSRGPFVLESPPQAFGSPEMLANLDLNCIIPADNSIFFPSNLATDDIKLHIEFAEIVLRDIFGLDNPSGEIVDDFVGRLMFAE